MIISRDPHPFSEMFSALRNAHRVEVLLNLARGEATVGELADAIGLAQSSLSQHLAVLRRNKLVKTRRSAQTIFYALDSEPLARILGLLKEMSEEHDSPESCHDEWFEHSL